MHAKYIKYLIDIIYDSRLGCCWGSSVVGVMKTAQLLRAMNISFINYPGVFCTGWTQGGPRCRVDNDKDTRPRKSWWCDCVRVSAVSRCEAGSVSSVLASIVLNRRMGRKPGRLKIFTRNTANGSSCLGNVQQAGYSNGLTNNTRVYRVCFADKYTMRLIVFEAYSSRSSWSSCNV